MSAWLKDAISGLFLMTFIVASFVMADMARAVFGCCKDKLWMDVCAACHARALAPILPDQN
jgi:hypothetical protein